MSPRLAAAALPLPPPTAAAAARGVAVPRPRTVLPWASVAFSSPSSCRGALACLVRLMCSCHSAAAGAAVEEARRGRKPLGMMPPLYDYLMANVRESPRAATLSSPSLISVHFVSTKFATVRFCAGKFRCILTAPSLMVSGSPGAPRGDGGHEGEPDAGASHSIANCIPHLYRRSMPFLTSCFVALMMMKSFAMILYSVQLKKN